MASDYREKVGLFIIDRERDITSLQDGYTLEEIDVYGVEDGQEVIVASKVRPRKFKFSCADTVL